MATRTSITVPRPRGLGRLGAMLAVFLLVASACGTNAPASPTTAASSPAAPSSSPASASGTASAAPSTAAPIPSATIDLWLGGVLTTSTAGTPYKTWVDHVI